LAQVDEEGHRQMMMDEVVDHRATLVAVPMEKGNYKTSKGWQLYVRWRDRSADWVELKDLKESYPVELAEYAITNGIQEQPAFEGNEECDDRIQRM
jgi:hypothetical protein